jgi:hypothetical protein
LQVAAFGLGAVGMTMNAWYARSLGSSEIAGWLFLAIGVAADFVALAIPACAAQQWNAGRRATAAVAWVIWWMPFAFTVTTGIGFASGNITVVTLARASRVTPAIETARNDLADAVTARDRECVSARGALGRSAGSDRRVWTSAAGCSMQPCARPNKQPILRPRLELVSSLG